MANEDNTNTQAETTTANTVVVPVPEPGQALAVTVDAEQIPQLSFDPGTESTQEFVGNDLVFTLDNGAVLTFVDFAASINDGEVTSLMLEDGSIIPIDALIAAWNLEVPETAAGEGAAGGGSSSYGDDMGDALGGIDKLGTQNPDPFGAAALATVEDEQTPIVIEGVNDAPAITVQTESNTVYEAGLIPDGSGNNPTSVTAEGTFTVTDTDGLDDIQSITLGTNVIAIGPGDLAALVGESFDAANGTVEITNYLGNGEFAYIYTLTSPTTDVEGAPETDSFNLSVSDEAGSASDTVTIEIIDDVPTALDDSGSVLSDATLTVDADNGVLNNDTEGADGAQVTSVGPGTQEGSSLILNPDGSYSYTAIPNASYVDTFTYTITDGDGDTRTADLVITVTDGSPTAPDANAEVNEAALDMVQDTGEYAAAGVVGSDGQSSTAELAKGTLATADSNGDALTYTPATISGTYGTLEIDAAGNYSYTLTSPVDEPTADDGTNTVLDAEVPFQYTVTDVHGNSSTGNITIDIIDDVPTALDDSGSVLSGATLTVDADNGVLNNDTEGADGAQVTSVGPGTQEGSSLILNPDGSYSYTAIPNASYVDTFTYTITDGDGDTRTADLVITVTDGSPTAPDANAEVNEAALDMVQDTGEYAAAGVVGSDGQSSTAELAKGTLATTDSNGDALTYTPATISGTYGTLEIDAAGNYSYTLTSPVDEPTADDGTNTVLDAEVPFQYTVTDVHGNSSTGNITIDIIDDVPTALDDSGSVLSGATLTVDADNGVLNNDTEGADGAQVTSVGPGTQEGSSLILNPDGSYSYTAIPNASYVDTFTYTITDGDGDTRTADLVITVTDGSPTAPDANAEVNEAALDMVQDTGEYAAAGVVGSDGQSSTAELAKGTLATTDSNGDALTYTPATISGTYGTLEIDAAGNYSYTLTSPVDEPTADDGTNTVLDAEVPFQYTVTDVHGNSSTGNITIDIIDDVPTALDDSGSVLSGATLTVDADNGVLNNDTEGADGAQVTSVGPGTQEGSSLILNPDGSYSYTAIPNASYVDTFTYTITDGDGDTRTADLVITVTDGSPTAPDANAEVNEAALDMVQDTGEYAAAGVVGSDGQSSTAELAKGTLATTDSNGDALTYTPATISGTYGTLEIDAAGNYSYTLTSPVDEPTADDGTNTVLDAEVPFQYTVTDVHGNSSTGNITIDIIDDVPTALDDSGSVLSGATLTVDADNGVLNNDTEGADGAQVTSVGPGTQEGSSLILNPDGSYSYTAIPNASYVDTFTYTITDGDGDTRTADLVITVTDGSPTAPDANAEVNEAALDMVQDTGEYAAAGVVGSDGQSSTAELAKGTLATTDSNGDALTYTPATISGTYGTLEIDAAGNYSYTLTSPVDEPTADDGTNTVLDAEVPFQYTVTDVHGNSSTGNITIDIIDDVPTALDDSGSVLSGATLTVDADNGVLNNDTEGADGAQVTSVGPGTQEGSSLILNPDGSYSYTAIPNASYVDTFTYTITDGDGDTRTADLVITVTDGSPTAPDANAEVNEAALDMVQDTGEYAAAGVVGSDGQSSTAELAKGTLATTDSNGDALTYTPATISGTYGTLEIDAAGNYSYTLTSPVDEPTADDGTNTVLDAEVPFQYTVTDVHGNSSTGNITIDIIDDVPTANEAFDSTTFNHGDNSFIVTEDLNVEFGADGFGSFAFTGFTDGEAGEVTANGDTSTMTIGGTAVLLFGAGTNQLIGTTNVNDANATVFTVDLNNDGTYTLDMAQALDSPAQFNVVDLGSLGISGGNGDYFIVGSGTSGTSEDDILITSVQPGGTINTSNTDFGTESQWVDPNNGVKFEFVENIEINGTNDGPRTLTGVQVQLGTVKGGATQTNVLIALYAGADNIIENLGEFNSVVTAINYWSEGVAISLNSPAEITQALSEGDIAIVADYNTGGVMISGIVVNSVDEHTTVGITTNTGFDTTDVVNHDGPDFSINGISGAYITNAPVSFDASFTATDGDGDVTTVDTFTMTLGPVIDGTNQADSLTGSGADELLQGFEGNDILVGGDGNDILFGGEDNDTLTGGAGEDTFVFSANEEEGINTITDFNTAEDTLSFHEVLDGGDLDLDGVNDNLDVDAITIILSGDGNADVTLTTDSGTEITLEGANSGGAFDNFASLGEFLNDDPTAINITTNPDAFGS